MKWVVITGASRGIGRATAEKFLAEGWFVIGTSTSGALSELAPHQNLKMRVLDLSSAPNIKSFADATGKTGQKIDALVNNAGVALDARSKLFSIDILRKTLEVNLIGLIDLTEQLLPHVQDGGHIINLSSSAGSLVEYRGAFVPTYQISKAAVNMYTRILGTRLAQRNIAVASIDPGWVKTSMNNENAPRDPSEPAREIYDLVASNSIESGYFWHQGKKRAW